MLSADIFAHQNYQGSIKEQLKTSQKKYVEL